MRLCENDQDHLQIEPEHHVTTTAYALPFYEQVLEFLASGPSYQEIVAYRPSKAAQTRFSRLLEANRERQYAGSPRSTTPARRSAPSMSYACLGR